MSRPSTIWQRKQDKCFYTTIRGEKVKLSPDKKEARQLFHELMAKEQEPAGTNLSPTFRKIADLFLDDSLKNKKPTTYRMAKMFLQSFCDSVGKRRVPFVSLRLSVARRCASRLWPMRAHVHKDAIGVSYNERKTR